MTATKTSRRNERNNPYMFDEMGARFHHSGAGALWRWRTELAAVAVVLAAGWRLAVMITLMWALVVLAVIAAGLAVWPRSRRFMTRRAWCVLARHRLQRLCWEARLHTRSGRLPLIVWIRPTKVGERAHILCRAGICMEDFEAHIGEIRAACYARDARVTRNPRWSQLVTIDIVRHDPLTVNKTIPSKVLDHSQPPDHSQLPALPELAAQEAS
jgi:hypothetical protein